MALFAIGDTHLSLSANKPMDVFGGGWTGYVDKLSAGFRALVAPEDTVVIAGDVSWGMSLEEAEKDFAFLDALPGKKLLLKGNHDYWWTTVSKMTRFFAEHGFTTLEILHNNCYFYGETALCGTRGWFYEEDQNGHNEKVFNRELIEGGGGAAEAVLSPLPALLRGLPLSGDHCPDGALWRGGLLLRPPPRRQPPPGGTGQAGRPVLPPDCGRFSGLSSAENHGLRAVSFFSEKRVEKFTII